MKRFSLVITFAFFIISSMVFGISSSKADTITQVDTLKYGDSLVIEKSVAITDTLQLENNTVEMATGLRSDGKIYVVILVLSIVLAGIFIFLISIDKRLKNLEKGEK